MALLDLSLFYVLIIYKYSRTHIHNIVRFYYDKNANDCDSAHIPPPSRHVPADDVTFILHQAVPASSLAVKYQKGIQIREKVSDCDLIRHSKLLRAVRGDGGRE